MENSTEAVVLKDGTSARRVFVAATMLALRRLFNGNGWAFYDLAKMVADTEHQASDRTIEALQRAGLAENGAIPRDIRDVVRNAVRWTSHGDAILGSPLAGFGQPGSPEAP